VIYKCNCGEIHDIGIELYFEIIKYKEYCYCPIISLTYP